MPDQSAWPAASRSVSAKLERLFAVQRPPHAPRRPWRNSEVVAACRGQGRELSESHLSELRRGVKTNPTVRVLETLAWFFEVRVGYFTDSDVAAEVELELAAREADLEARLHAEDDAQQEEAAAARELQQALRQSGARSAHRGVAGAQARQRASMMRALSRALTEESEGGQEGQARDPGPPT